MCYCARPLHYEQNRTSTITRYEWSWIYLIMLDVICFPKIKCTQVKKIFFSLWPFWVPIRVAVPIWSLKVCVRILIEEGRARAYFRLRNFSCFAVVHQDLIVSWTEKTLKEVGRSLLPKYYKRGRVKNSTISPISIIRYWVAGIELD